MYVNFHVFAEFYTMSGLYKEIESDFLTNDELIMSSQNSSDTEFSPDILIPSQTSVSSSVPSPFVVKLF